VWEKKAGETSGEEFEKVKRKVRAAGKEAEDGAQRNLNV
jgi:hypothetical protein